MKRNRKLAIMIVLITVSIFVWFPKGKKTKDSSSTTSSVTFDQVTPVTRAVLRKRTEFADWPRNPFAWPQGEEKAGGISHLQLFAIIGGDDEAQAYINESLVRVGDKITDKTVKQIEQNQVILTDGTQDYVLKLRE